MKNLKKDLHLEKLCAIITKLSVRHAPLAQLDRASGYGPEGREFESLRAYQKRKDERLGAFAFSGTILPSQP